MDICRYQLTCSPANINRIMTPSSKQTLFKYWSKQHMHDSVYRFLLSPYEIFNLHGTHLCMSGLRKIDFLVPFQHFLLVATLRLFLLVLLCDSNVSATLPWNESESKQRIMLAYWIDTNSYQLICNISTVNFLSWIKIKLLELLEYF